VDNDGSVLIDIAWRIYKDALDADGASFRAENYIWRIGGYIEYLFNNYCKVIMGDEDWVDFDQMPTLFGVNIERDSVNPNCLKLYKLVGDGGNL